jgi:uncharacterized protein
MRVYGAASEGGSQWLAAHEANAFLSAVYGWMCIGLAITAATAWYVAASTALMKAVAANPGLFWGVIIIQFLIVFVLSARVQTLTAPVAAVLFVVYAGLMGVTMSFVLLAYTGESVARTFLVAAGMFGGLATYGTITKRSLGGLGQFIFMGLIGVVLASIVNLFWHNDAFQFVLSFAGVIVFSGLVAYDAQRLRLMALETPDGRMSYAIVGALALYLDFTNLFLFLLRFSGNRRQSDW